MHIHIGCREVTLVASQPVRHDDAPSRADCPARGRRADRAQLVRVNAQGMEDNANEMSPGQ